MKKYKLLNSGIKVNRELEEYEKTHICHTVADVLRRKYPYLSCNYLQIITDLYNTKMYIVEDENKVSLVNYIYQNQSIYFSEKKDLKIVDENIIHECIHKLQDKRTKNGRLMQLGNCEFTLSKAKGLAFNEAANQYIVAEMLNREYKEIRSNNLKLKLPNESYYLITANLMKQIMMLIEEDEILAKSTISANNDFNYKMIDYFGEKEFYSIRENFDKIEKLQINGKTENAEKIYLETQKIIYQNYFNKQLKYIDSLSEIDIIKQKLENYFYFIENTDIRKEDIEEYKVLSGAILFKEENIKNKYALMVVKNNSIRKLFNKLREFITAGKNSEY